VTTGQGKQLIYLSGRDPLKKRAAEVLGGKPLNLLSFFFKVRKPWAGQSRHRTAAAGLQPATNWPPIARGLISYDPALLGCIRKAPEKLLLAYFTQRMKPCQKSGAASFISPCPKSIFPLHTLQLLCDQVLRGWGEVRPLPQWHTQKSSTRFADRLVFHIRPPKTFICGCYRRLVAAERRILCCWWDTKAARLTRALSFPAAGTQIKLCLRCLREKWEKKG